MLRELKVENTVSEEGGCWAGRELQLLQECPHAVTVAWLPPGGHFIYKIQLHAEATIAV